MVGRGNGGGGGGSKDTPWKGLMLATWPSDRLTKIWSGELPATPPQPQQQQATGKRSKQAVSFWRAKPPPGSGWFSLGDFCAVETAAAGASGRVKVPLDVKLPCISRNGRRTFGMDMRGKERGRGRPRKQRTRETANELQTVLASLMRKTVQKQCKRSNMLSVVANRLEMHFSSLSTEKRRRKRRKARWNG